MGTLTLALDAAGTLVSALVAPRHAPYTCLECGGRLHVRRGPERAAHFAHDHEDAAGCAGESVTHLAAKRLLRTQLQAELEHDTQVTWSQRCPGVTGPCRLRAVLPRHHRLDGPGEVREEVTQGPYRLDVAVVVDGQVAFGFEVYHRHAVPEEKALGLDVPWLELVAEDILEFKPRVPCRGSTGTVRCPDCDALARALEQRRERDAARGAQTAKYATEVDRVRATWRSVLDAARATDEQQRAARQRRGR